MTLRNSTRAMTTSSETKAPWARMRREVAGGEKRRSPRPMRLSAPLVSRMVRESTWEATWKAMREGRLAWMTPVMTAAARWDLPVLQHSWSQTNIRERSFHTDPEDTCRLARRHPEVRLIMAHLTGCGRRGVKAARGLRNVWVDTSGGAPEAGLVEYAVEQGGADRVLYGSDAPIRDLPVAIARITGAAIKEEAKRAMLYVNARALLRLP